MWRDSVCLAGAASHAGGLVNHGLAVVLAGIVRRSLVLAAVLRRADDAQPIREEGRRVRAIGWERKQLWHLGDSIFTDRQQAVAPAAVAVVVLLHLLRRAMIVVVPLAPMAIAARRISGGQERQPEDAQHDPEQIHGDRSTSGGAQEAAPRRRPGRARTSEPVAGARRSRNGGGAAERTGIAHTVARGGGGNHQPHFKPSTAALGALRPARGQTSAMLFGQRRRHTHGSSHRSSRRRKPLVRRNA